jgi:hypothetical protein
LGALAQNTTFNDIEESIRDGKRYDEIRGSRVTVNLLPVAVGTIGNINAYDNLIVFFQLLKFSSFLKA